MTLQRLFLIALLGVLLVQSAIALSIHITSVENGDKFDSCASIMLQAEVQQDDANLRRVQFYNGNKTIKTLRAEPWEFLWEGVPDGIYDIYAKVTDLQNVVAFSDTLQIFIGNIADGEKLYNGEFACGLEPWHLSVNAEASAQIYIEPDGWLASEPSMAMVEIDNPGSVNWHVMLIQPMPLDSGHVYEFYLMAEVEAAKEIAIDLQSSSGDYTVWNWQSVTLEPGTYEYGPITWESNVTDPTNEFKIPLSADKTTVYIDAIQAIDKNWVENTTAVQQDEPVVTREFELYQNYPNPFNPNTEIQFELPEAQTVRLTVFNIKGQKIATLLDGQVSAGLHSVSWNAVDALGIGVPSGVYIYKLETANFELSKRMLLIK